LRRRGIGKTDGGATSRRFLFWVAASFFAVKRDFRQKISRKNFPFGEKSIIIHGASTRKAAAFSRSPSLTT
jgi:hypothetical protein